MKCDRVDLGNGDFVIACSRGQSRKCSSCGAYVRDGVLCDFVLKDWKTCDRHCCRSCAVRVGPNRDYCPPHARYVALGQDSPDPGPVEAETKNKGQRTKQMAIAQPTSVENLFDGLRGAKVFQRSKSMGPDFEGRVRIVRVETDNTRFGAKLFVKYHVVSTNDPEKFPVGLERTWKQPFTTSKGPEVAMGNMLLFAAACAGIPREDEERVEAVKEDAIRMLVGAVKSPDDNIFVGVELGLSTEGTKTESDYDFTIHNWAP